jgi:hypothetical protein
MVCLGIADSGDYFVMAGLDPAIHVFCMVEVKTWMPGTRPGMTTEAGDDA